MNYRPVAQPRRQQPANYVYVESRLTSRILLPAAHMETLPENESRKAAHPTP